MKKKRYEKSSIQEVVALSKYKNDDWTQQDIEEREEKFVKDIIGFINENMGQNFLDLI